MGFLKRSRENRGNSTEIVLDEEFMIKFTVEEVLRRGLYQREYLQVNKRGSY